MIVSIVTEYCKDCKNFNSMFALISGLGYGAVSRLRLTWDKLPTKYVKMFEDLQNFLDPTRNMLNYRNLINSTSVNPPSVSLSSNAWKIQFYVILFR